MFFSIQQSKPFIIFALFFFVVSQMGSKSVPASIFPGGLPSLGGGGSTSGSGATSTSSSSGIPGMAQLTTSVNTLNTTISSTNASIQSGLSLAGQYNTNWQNTNTQVSQINQNWATTNSELQRLLNPTNAFVVGAAAGIGYAVGGAFISATVELVKAGAEWLYEKATHKKRNAVLLQKFEEAKQAYPEALSAMEEIEARVDSYFFVAREAAQAKQDGVELIDSLNSLIEQLTITSKTYSTLALNLSQKALPDQLRAEARGLPVLDDQEILGLSKNNAQTKAKIRKLVKLRDAMESTSGQGLCNRMKMESRMLIQALENLQEIRVGLTDPLSERVWKTARNKQHEEFRESAKRSQDKERFASLFKFEKKLAKNSLEKGIAADPELKSYIDRAMTACLKERKSIIGRIPKLGRYLSSSWKICWSTVTDPNSDYAKDTYDELLRPYAEASQSLYQNAEERQQDSSDLFQYREAIFKDPKNKLRSSSASLTDATDLSDTAEPARKEYVRLNPQIVSEAFESFDKFIDELRRDQTLAETSKKLESLKSKRREILTFCQANPI